MLYLILLKKSVAISISICIKSSGVQTFFVKGFIGNVSTLLNPSVWLFFTLMVKKLVSISFTVLETIKNVFHDPTVREEYETKPSRDTSRFL